MDPMLIIAAINGGIQLIDLAVKTAENLKKSGEMSPADEAALDATLADLKSKSWWQPKGDT